MKRNQATLTLAALAIAFWLAGAARPGWAAPAETAEALQRQLWEAQTKAELKQELATQRDELAKLRYELAEERGKREGLKGELDKVDQSYERFETHLHRYTMIFFTFAMLFGFLLTFLGYRRLQGWLLKNIEAQAQSKLEGMMAEARKGWEAHLEREKQGVTDQAEKASKEIEQIKQTALALQAGQAQTDPEAEAKRSKFTDYLQKKPKDQQTPEDWLALANLHYENADYNQAVDLYQKVVQAQPKNYVAHFNLAYSLSELGKSQEAIDHYTIAIDLKPNFADTYINRGVLFKALGEREKALQDYNQAIDLKPDDATAFYNRGILYA